MISTFHIGSILYFNTDTGKNKMLRPIKRFFKAIWWAITFRAHEKSDELLRSPDVVRLIYERIISKKRDNLILYKKGIEKLTIQNEKKIDIHKGLSEDINNIEKMKTRVNTEQNKIVTDLQKTDTSYEMIEQHPSYIRCINANNNFHTILEKKYTHLAKLEKDIEQGYKDIEKHTNHITRLQNNLDQLKKEQFEFVDDLIFEQQQEEFVKIKLRNH